MNAAQLAQKVIVLDKRFSPENDVQVSHQKVHNKLYSYNF